VPNRFSIAPLIAIVPEFGTGVTNYGVTTEIAQMVQRVHSHFLPFIVSIRCVLLLVLIYSNLQWNFFGKSPKGTLMLLLLSKN
jgi:hypothetical protein